MSSEQSHLMFKWFKFITIFHKSTWFSTNNSFTEIIKLFEFTKIHMTKTKKETWCAKYDSRLNVKKKILRLRNLKHVCLMCSSHDLSEQRNHLALGSICATTLKMFCNKNNRQIRRNLETKLFLLVLFQYYNTTQPETVRMKYEEGL